MWNNAKNSDRREMSHVEIGIYSRIYMCTPYITELKFKDTVEYYIILFLWKTILKIKLLNVK